MTRELVKRNAFRQRGASVKSAVTDVSGVEDELDALEYGLQFRPKQPVRAGDKSDQMHEHRRHSLRDVSMVTFGGQAPVFELGPA